jgi:hypothetical protein
MANWIFTVVDATTGQPLGGAEVTGTANTNPCPSFDYNCTSGNGYNFTGNTDPNGVYKTNISWTCVQDLSYQASAPGYNPTSDTYASGFITGDVYIPTIQLTPIQNVTQDNQGAAGTTAATLQTAGQNVTSWSTTDTVVVLFAVVGTILAVVLMAAKKKA